MWGYIRREEEFVMTAVAVGGKAERVWWRQDYQEAKSGRTEGPGQNTWLAGTADRRVPEFSALQDPDGVDAILIM